MLRGSLLPNIIRYTIPIIITSLLQRLFSAADLIVVGKYCGSIYVAAIGATGSIIDLMLCFFIGLSVGAGVTVAHGLGEGNSDAVHNTVHTALLTALVSGVILTVFGVIFGETFLSWMGTPETVLPLAAKYMRIYFAGITFNIIYNFCASILRAAGDTTSPWIALSAVGVINVILNIVFVVVFQANVGGVALATTISQAISAVALVIVLIRRKDACRLQLHKLRFYKTQLKKILRIGLPSGIQSALFSISNVLIQSSINSFGDVFVSGVAAASNIEGFVCLAMSAFHQTAMNFVGHNMGAQQYDRVKKILWICLASAAVVGLCGGLTVYKFGDHLLSIYITDSQEAISYGMIHLAYLCIPYFINGMMDVCTGVLLGMGISFVPMWITVLGVCGIRLGWIYTIFQMDGFHTPQCLLAAYPISWVVTFLALLVAFFILYRKQTHKISP